MIIIDGRQLRGVIFDMDGLMFDTESVYTITWPIAAKRFGYEVTRDVVEGAIGLNAEDGRRYFEAAYGEDFPFYDIRKERLKIAMDYVCENGLKVKKGLYNLIGFLKSEHIKRAVATSSERWRADKYLSMSRLEDSFEAVVCGDEVRNGKPMPDIFLTAAQRIGVNIRECAVFEDSFNGIRAAHASGALAYMVPDCRQPDEEIASILDQKFDDLDQAEKYMRAHLIPQPGSIRQTENNG